MDNGFIDKDEAAQRLGVSLRSIYKLLNAGRLRPAFREGKSGVCTASLRQYQAARAAELSSCSAGEMQLRLRQLESRVALLLRLVGVEARSLGLNGHELVSLHRMAAHNAEQGWSRHEEPMWADAFERLDVEDLLSIEAATGDDHPWSAFYRLCAAMRHAALDAGLQEQFYRGLLWLGRLATLWVYEREPTVKLGEQCLARKGRMDGRVLRKLRRRAASNEWSLGNG